MGSPKKIKTVQKAVDLLLGGTFCDVWGQSGDRAKLPQPKFPMGLWFRGQADAAWKLRPSVFRKVPKIAGSARYVDEASTFYHFKLRLPAFSHDCHSTFDWLALMQHHQLPTRLLDWTESILVGLFFTVCEWEKFKDRDGKLFALDARRLNHLCGFDMRYPELAIPEEFDTVLRAEMAVTHRLDRLIHRKAVTDAAQSYLPDGALGRHPKITKAIQRDKKKAIQRLRSPVAVFPRRLHGRMTFQSSMFTLHGGKRLWERQDAGVRLIPEPIHLEEVDESLEQGDKILKELLVPAAAKEKIRNDLQRLGIHEGSLFPEADYQSRYVRERWTFPDDAGNPCTSSDC